jgi:seryl-tRNA synthetase
MAKFDFNEGVPVKKPSRAGWIVAGLVTILGAGFVGAFYLPLASAHQLLMTKHEELAKKTQELDQELKSSGANLKTSSAQLSAMQKVMEEAKSEQSAYDGQVSEISQAAKKGYDKLVSAKQVSVNSTPSGISATAKGTLLFRPKSAATLPFANKFACAGSGSLSSSSKASVAVHVEPDPAGKDGYARAAEQAGALADVLRTVCKVDAARLKVALSPGGKGDPGDVTLLFSAGEPPQLPRE